MSDWLTFPFDFSMKQCCNNIPEINKIVLNREELI